MAEASADVKDLPVGEGKKREPKPKKEPKPPKEKKPQQAKKKVSWLDKKRKSKELGFVEKYGTRIMKRNSIAAFTTFFLRLPGIRLLSIGRPRVFLDKPRTFVAREGTAY